jgi:hypothetical protein
MYAYRDNYGWNKVKVESDKYYEIGIHNSICVDSKDKPHISYIGNSALKYAWYGQGDYIHLTSFSAKPNNNAITLNWSISTDEYISGFNLYRRVVPPGAIHELPLQTPVGTDYNLSTPASTRLNPVGAVRELPTTVGKDLSQRDSAPGDEHPCPDDTQWTRVNTSLITGTNPYSYTDRTVMPETNYEYKLEAVKNDRTETLGTIECESGNPSSYNITIYPNPLYDNNINIDIISASNVNNVNLNIYDISGRLVNSELINIITGINKISIDTTMFSSGVYIIKITSGEVSVNKRFVNVR